MLGPWVWSLLNNTTGAWHMAVTFLLGHCWEFVKVTLHVLDTSELVFVLDLPWHDLRSWLHIQSQLLNYLLRVSFKSPVKFLLRVCEDHIRGTWHSATSPLHCVLYALVSGESACAQLCSTVKKKSLNMPPISGRHILVYFALETVYFVIKILLACCCSAAIETKLFQENPEYLILQCP